MAGTKEPGTKEAGTKEAGTEAADHADDLLVAILTTNWTLATGRALPAGVSPRSLSEDLISFWADDWMANASGTASGAGQP